MVKRNLNMIETALKQYKEACNTLLKAFCDRHEYDMHYSFWVGDAVGEIAVVNDDWYISMENIITDLIDRGFGVGGVDFLKTTEMPEDCTCILTNPPYIKATEFVLHALDLLPQGGVCVMFLKTLFLEGKGRYKQLYSKQPPKYVFQFSERQKCGLNGVFDDKNSAVAYAWYVWEKGYQGDTIVKWI